MTYTLTDGTVIGDDCRAALRSAKSANQEVVARFPTQIGGECVNCHGQGELWFCFLRGNGTRSPQGISGTPRLWHKDAWYDFEGKPFPCPVCNENNTDRIIRLWEASGLSAPERAWRLDYLNGRGGKLEALNTSYEFLEACPRPVGWVSFFGKFGVGKSGLLKSLVAACVRAGVSARYVRGLDILSEARNTYGDESKESEQILVARYARYQFLAIDEVDRVSGTEWARSMLFQVLDDRYNRREIAATAIATNSVPGGMNEMWGYLESRMRDGARVIVGGDDLRGNQ